MMFKGRVCHYARITRHSKSAVKLANGKATEVRKISKYAVLQLRSAMVLGCFVAGRNVLLPNLKRR